MSHAQLPWLQLALTPGVGPMALLRLIDAFGSAEQVLHANQTQLKPLLGDATAALLQREGDAAAEAALAWAEQPGCTLITLLDADYPAQLATIHGPPPVLFARGRRELLTQPMLAIVGSRQATPAGRDTARSFAQRLGEAGYTIVSGLASGIDAAAHDGALATVASSVAVIGTGIDRVYPASNRALAHRLAEHGLILSEFPLGIGPLAANFPRRNRIIAGLSAGCLVVEANVRSGSLITARLAAEAGREVLAVPGSILNPQARGCHQLIKDGATLVETVDDVLAELGRPAAAPPPAPTEPNPQTVAETSESPLLEAMGFDATDADTLTSRLGLTTGEVYAMLLELELEGRVASLPGGRFQRLT
jgi:DNA processing protein